MTNPAKGDVEIARLELGGIRNAEFAHEALVSHGYGLGSARFQEVGQILLANRASQYGLTGWRRAAWMQAAARRLHELEAGSPLRGAVQ